MGERGKGIILPLPPPHKKKKKRGEIAFCNKNRRITLLDIARKVSFTKSAAESGRSVGQQNERKPSRI